MPIAEFYDPEDKRLRTIAEKELKQQRRKIKTALAYYEGQHKPSLKDTRDFVIVNLCQIVVNVVADFLIPEMPRITTSDPVVTAKLSEVFAHNRGATLLHKLATWGGIFGHVFLRVWIDEDEVSLHPINPGNILVFHDQELKPVWYEQHWQNETSEGITSFRQDIVKTENNTWQIRVFMRKPREREWKLIDEHEWLYTFPPIIEWQHGESLEYLGRSELEHAELNDKINDVISDIKRIIRFHASPRVIGLGVNVEDITNTPIDGFWAIPSTSARIELLQGVSQLDAAHQCYLTLINAFLTQSQIVLLPNDLKQFTNVTNLGIQATFLLQTRKIERLRRNYEYGLKRLAKLLVQILFADKDVTISIEWPEVLPIAQSEKINSVQEMMKLGVLSKRTASDILGLDFNTEQTNIDAETFLDPSTGFVGGVNG